MTVLAARLPRIMALHPGSHGFGWAVFEGPLAPHDWGVVCVAKDKNVGCLNQAEKMLARFHPETLILETFEERVSARRSRITRFCRSLVALAVDRGIEVAVYSRQHIAQAFKGVGGHTRHEIAEAVARHIEPLRQHLPKKRKPWNGEDKRMSVFAAAALVLTHYHLGANQLFADLIDQTRDNS